MSPVFTSCSLTWNDSYFIWEKFNFLKLTNLQSQYLWLPAFYFDGILQCLWCMTFICYRVFLQLHYCFYLRMISVLFHVTPSLGLPLPHLIKGIKINLKRSHPHKFAISAILFFSRSKELNWIFHVTLYNWCGSSLFTKFPGKLLPPAQIYHWPFQCITPILKS